MPSQIPFFIQEQFEFKTKTLLSASVLIKGWYIINLLFPLTSFQKFDLLARNQIKLESKDMIQPGWYRIYLKEEQISFLMTNHLASLYPIVREKAALSDSDLYLVYATPDFKPPTNQYSKIDDNLFIFSNISLIKNDPKVLKIASHSRPMLTNRYAGGFSENLNEFPSFDDENRFLIPRPLHQIGLTGEGQIVSVSDSGLDTHHCFFYDPRYSAPFSSPNFNHRKIALYDPVADNLDAERGHGTHVCGIIVGNALCQNCGIDQYNGVAPGAKVYMHDLGDLKNGAGSIIDVNVPYYVERMRVASSYISSNSWGYSSGESEIRAAFSKYAYDNPDLLFVFACGNSYNSYTIHTPSNSKNVLAIGALTSPFGALFDASSDALFFASKNENGYKTILTHNSGTKISDSLKSTPPVIYRDKNVFIVNPNDSSTNINNLNMNQDIVIIDNSNSENIFNTEPCQFAAGINNASLIIFSKKLVDVCKANVPIFCIANNSIDKNYLYSLKTITVQPYFTGKREPVGKLGLSSQGPSNFGYTKPEIVASGQNVQSARAGSPYVKFPRECTYKTIVSKSGTSMAAPVASGVLLMIRQYFADGWYPSSSKPEIQISNQTKLLNFSSSSDMNIPFKPSSTLLRAFAVNSAQKVSTLIATGFGVMNPYKGLGFTGIGLRVANNIIINSSEHHIFKITVTKEGFPLQVTLSYLDPPLPASSGMPLFADLDLVVITPSGKIFKGNGFENNLDEDQFATTEKVIINDAEKGKYTIHVLSSSFGMPSEVPYSIVINGGFDQTDFSTNPAFLTEEKTNKCYAKCKYGSCVNGVCVCNSQYFGHACDKKATFNSLKQIQPELKNKVVKYYIFLIRDERKKENRTEHVFTIRFSNVDSHGIGYCFNFDGKPLKISEPNQECFFQTRSEKTLSFNSSVYPNIKPGNHISMSLYGITNNNMYVDLTITGIKAHFSLVFWYTHLPLWMMITVASSVALVVLLIVIILMLLCIKPAPKKKKKRAAPANANEEPHPTVIEHDPKDNLSIDENLL